MDDQCNTGGSMKGQITIYILLGIVLLAALSTGIYLTTKYALKPTTIAAPQTDIKNYINDCLAIVGTEAIKLLGQHGGYIDPTDPTLTGKAFNLNDDQTESDALFLSPPQDNPVIYWWHLKSKNNCKECELTTENAPALENMLTQVEKYIPREINKCLNNFEPFLKQGYHIQTEQKTTKVIPTETNVRISLTMPTIISRGGTETKETLFETIIDVPLKKIHTIATEIIKDAIRTQRLETAFLHSLAQYSDVDFAKLPPISDITHTSHTVTWNKQLVEQNIRTLLTTTTPSIRIKTDKNTDSKDPFTYTLPNISMQDLSTTFSYLDSSFYFDINPKEKNKLLPDIDRTSFPYDFAAPFQTNYYEFFYDISAPILITITAPQALKKQGYAFYLATELNLRKNKNLLLYHIGEGTIAPLDPNKLEPSVTKTDIEVTKCEQPEQNVFVCPLDKKTYNETRICHENCHTKQKTTGIANFNTTFFCDENQRLSGAVRIQVIDAITKQPLPNIPVNYYCGKQLACGVGATNSRGLFRQKLPLCKNGIIKIHTEEYYPYANLITTEYGQRLDETVKLEPIKTLKTTIKKAHVTLTPQGTKTCCTYSLISQFENIALTLQRIKENPWDSSFSAIASYTKDDPTPSISLVPGKYSVQATTIDNLGFIIPKKCKQVDLQTYIPEENIIVKPAMLGGIIINNETGYWKIDSAALAKAEKIDFTIIKIPTPTCLDNACIAPPCVGMDEMGKIDEYTKQFSDKVWPKLLLQ